MGRKFHAEVSPKWPLSDTGLSSVLRTMIEREYVARTERGFIAGAMFINPIANNWPVASEFLWWSEGGDGLTLRRGFREWAEQMGAREIRWSCPADNHRVRRVYARHSEETEIIYSEFLPCA